MSYKFFKVLFSLFLICSYAFSQQSYFTDEKEPDATLQAKVIIKTDEQIGVINPDIYGLFMEMCYYEFNGGIWVATCS